MLLKGDHLDGYRIADRPITVKLCSADSAFQASTIGAGRHAKPTYASLMKAAVIRESCEVGDILE